MSRLKWWLYALVGSILVRIARRRIARRLRTTAG
jgi:hypothetical protein